MLARNVLILAPHPDDEIVACSLAAMRARAWGVRVFVLYLTTGVPEAAALWPWQRGTHRSRVARRRVEAQAAAVLLGLAPIAFRDTPTRRLRHDLDRAQADIEAALAACAAEVLWAPAFEGAHQDHDAANALAAMFVGGLPVWEFAAYNFAGGRVRSNEFPADTGGEIAIAASPEEAGLKRRALACYASERGNLGHIRVEREVCRPLLAHRYAAPPHAGRLFRERFHWVPFRHPRVDFDRSSEVYRDIAGWVSARAGQGAPALDQRPGEKARQAHREFAGALDQAESERRLGR